VPLHEEVDRTFSHWPHTALSKINM